MSDLFLNRAQSLLGQSFQGYAPQDSNEPITETEKSEPPLLKEVLVDIVVETEKNAKPSEFVSENAISNLLCRIEDQLEKSDDPCVLINHDGKHHYARRVLGNLVSSAVVGGSDAFVKTTEEDPEVLTINLPTFAEHEQFQAKKARSQVTVNQDRQGGATVVDLPPSKQEVNGDAEIAATANNDDDDEFADFTDFSSAPSDAQGDEKSSPDSKPKRSKEQQQIFPSFKKQQQPVASTKATVTKEFPTKQQQQRNAMVTGKQFLSKIPNLSFMLETTLQLPNKKR